MRAVVRAALHMQRVFRGYQGRVLRGQRARRVAATMFQCFFRGWVIRERNELGTRMSDEDPQMWRAHANIASLIRALTAVELRRNEFERRSKAAIRFVEASRLLRSLRSSTRSTGQGTQRRRRQSSWREFPPGWKVTTRSANVSLCGPSSTQFLSCCRSARLAKR